MLHMNSDLSRVIKSVHETMRAPIAKQKNAALLPNLTRLKPIINNETRWSAKLPMLEQFLNMIQEFKEASNYSQRDKAIDMNVFFMSETKKYETMLSEIDVVTKSLQTSGYTLKKYQDPLDTVIDAIQE